MNKVTNALKSRTTQNVAACAPFAITRAQVLVHRLAHATPALPWENAGLDLTTTTTAFVPTVLTAISSRILAFLRTPTKRNDTFKR